MDDFEKELKLGFLDEASQGISDTEQCFLDLESKPDDAEVLNKIFRLAHNLKGSSKAVGFDQMGAFTHELESFILKIKNGEIPASRKVITTLLESTDFVKLMIEGLKANLEAKFDTESLIQKIKDTAAQPTDEVAATEVATPDPVLEVVAEAPPTASPEVEMPVSAAVTVAPVIAMPSPAKPAKPASAPAASTASTNKDESIRVSVSRVETLLNYIGEMVILQSVLKDQAVKTQSLEIKKTLHQLQKITKEVQDVSMSLRMVPVKMTFQKMQRIVRDTALALDKDVNFVIEGEETEVDKTVLEKINDPLVHLIRNSVDHGIESKDRRKETKKNPQGQVRLSAFHRSGKLYIEVKDDGGGLDPQKLIKKAIEKKLISPDQKLTDEQAYQLIFAPGFSTKEVVTDVSGRGVGMDVVKTNIQELSGDVSIFSKLGEGTTFQIELPLTLAIIEGMTINYGEDRYVIPFNHVFETLRPSQKDVQYNISLGDTLMLRGESMPIFRLGDFFGRPSQLKNDSMIALVIRSLAKPFALLVDDVVGHTQVVVKQLGSELQDFKGVSGCTILGDGKPALIIEPADLIKRKLSRSVA